MAILDLTLGEVSKLLALSFISLCNICVSSILFVSAVSLSFGGGHRLESLAIFVGGFTSLNRCLAGRVWARLSEWVFSTSGAIGTERYTVGSVPFSSTEEEDDERMVFMTTDVLYLMLDVLDIFLSGVASLAEEKMEEFASLLSWWDATAGSACHDCLDASFPVGLLSTWSVGQDLDTLCFG